MLGLLRGLALVVITLLVTILGVRAYDALTGPPLAPWHTFVPDEPDAAAIDAMDWAAWSAREAALFDDVLANVVAEVPAADRVPANRYYAGSPLHPWRFATDWNRSFVLEPDGAPRGSVVLLHGLTDSPYSLRHVARAYRDRGFVAIGIRLPGHGTVPAGLTAVATEDWRAATRLAVRTAAARAPDAPLHIVGYSNGGALAALYALEALALPGLRPPDQIVLISPMIGITGFARFSGLAALPAYIPAFVRAAWFDTLPEFNPVKYNSFPVNGGSLSHHLTRELQAALAEADRSGRLAAIAPVLAFQSVVDSTVNTAAVVGDLFERLPPANGSELVLFDLNRAAYFGPLIAPTTETRIGALLPPAPRGYAATLVTNAGPGDYAAVARHTPAGATEATEEPLGLDYPRTIFSLGHVALPFPPHDGIYGTEPDPSDDFGVRIGATSGRGEAGVMVVGLDFFSRIMSNPFYDYLENRIAQRIP
jgi:alpha-beta hydrolase superfamily lysophospholipase